LFFPNLLRVLKWGLSFSSCLGVALLPLTKCTRLHIRESLRVTCLCSG
jgi:hypothetical protein